jgi:hypothetical protein
MQYASVLAQDREGRLWFRGGASRKLTRVSSVTEAAGVLSRTRRQIYRCLHDGSLISVSKLLGEWLIDFDSVERLRANVPMKRRLPGRFQVFFPEFRVGALNPGKERVLIVSRLLEQGGVADIRWLVHTYGAKGIRQVVSEEGNRLLSRRTLHFWSLLFGVPPRPSRVEKGSDPWDGRHREVA